MKKCIITEGELMRFAEFSHDVVEGYISVKLSQFGFDRTQPVISYFDTNRCVWVYLQEEKSSQK